jgi:ATP-dependent HslUV protease ATP-binding subunit HslU
MEKLFEEISFNAPDMQGEIVIDAKYVSDQLGEIARDRDLSRYIL